jgi:hypothetical protein
MGNKRRGNKKSKKYQQKSFSIAADKKQLVLDSKNKSVKNPKATWKEMLWNQTWLNNDDYSIVRFSFLLYWLYFVFPYLIFSRQTIGYRAFNFHSFFSLSVQSSLKNKQFGSNYENKKRSFVQTTQKSAEMNIIDKQIVNSANSNQIEKITNLSMGNISNQHSNKGKNISGFYLSILFIILYLKRNKKYSDFLTYIPRKK